MNLPSRSKSKTDPNKVAQVRDWVYNRLPISPDIAVSVNQLICKEPGYPPIKTVIAVMTRPPQQYKIYKPIADLNYSDFHNILRPTCPELD
ncbi:MAG: hypothetical protein KME15_10275 [Drouetiella hepatica Uher 2000/2452]|jgi:hypothetical protein|uniref:Uncharacterized protein n=1 Tax=Drouetiella hepatica Uher 2000/2452 TaxID=904376 RepID=A0A951QA93_9CYAN|nr:hypothetical protein [Drouetiella hepatica Uher 2000/2452]